jgi:hypothetical protein
MQLSNCYVNSTTQFRDAAHSSHEVRIDARQLKWFERICEEHSHADGWNVLVFTHAPPMGSGLRVVQVYHCANSIAVSLYSAVFVCM